MGRSSRFIHFLNRAWLFHQRPRVGLHPARCLAICRALCITFHQQLVSFNHVARTTPERVGGSTSAIREESERLVLFRIYNQPTLFSGYPVLNLVPSSGKEQTYETNNQRPLPGTTLRPPPGPQFTSNMSPSLPRNLYPPLFPSTWGSSAQWVPSCPPTVTFSLKGPHFSYDRTAPFSPTTQEYKDLLLGKDVHRNPDLYRKIKYIRYVARKLVRLS